MNNVSDFDVSNTTVVVEDWLGHFTLSNNGETRTTQIGDWDLSAADVAAVLASIPGLENPTKRAWLVAPKHHGRETTLHLLNSYSFASAPRVVQLTLGRDDSYVEVYTNEDETPVFSDSLASAEWSPLEFESEIEDAGYGVASLWVVWPQISADGGERALICRAMCTPLNEEEWQPVWI